MTLPTFLEIPAGQLVPGGPTLAEHPVKLQDQGLHNRAYIGGVTYTPEEDHDHDGINSALAVLGPNQVVQANIAPGAVGRSQLKVGTETKSFSHVGASATTYSAWVNTGGYGFRSKVRVVEANGIAHTVSVQAYDGYSQALAAFGDTGYVDSLFLASQSSGPYGRTAYAQCIYETASPPHPDFLDGNDHGPWVFQIRDKRSGRVLESWSADDPPWWLRGWNKYGPEGKRHPGRFFWMPHPWADQNLEAPDGLEYVVLDLRHMTEVVEDRPALRALELHRSEAKEMVAMGADAAALAAHERVLLERVEAEAGLVLEARDGILAAEAELADQIKSVHHNSRLSDDDMDRAIRRLRDRHQRKVDRLKPFTGRTRKIDRIPSGDWLHTLDLEACTECLSSDRSRPERSRLPGIFTNSSDSPWLVRVLTPK